MAGVSNKGLPGGRKADDSQEGLGASRASSLESQLQRAWLQSQLPKVPRRSVSAPLASAFGEKRTCSQSSAELPLGVVSGGVVDGGDLEKAYPHKTRADVASEFLRRFSTPQLETISKKTDVPPPLESRNSAPIFSDSFSESSSASSSSLCSTSDDFSVDTQHSVKGGVFDALDLECIGSGSADLAGETEPLALFLDDILADGDLEDEKCLIQQTSAFHAMEKEISNLLAPDSGGDVSHNPEDEDAHDKFWINVEFEPTEESSAYQAMGKEIADLLSSEPTILDYGGPEAVSVDCSTDIEFPLSEERMAWKLMERYTSMLSKHVEDVSCCSGNVDYRTWITESDEIQFDGVLKSYLESSEQISATAPIFDFNLLLRGIGGANLSRESATVPPTMSITELLYKCAFAVSQGNAESAAKYLTELQNHSSPFGTPVQRMAHYFMEALVAKMSGTGEELCTAINNNIPSDVTMFKAFRVYVDNNPYIKICHFFSTKSALDAFEGAPRVHVIHYGLYYGVEWPSLLRQLSLRPEGPPHVRMTAVDFPCPGLDPLKKINNTGKRLEKFAKMWGVPFEFQAFASRKWESYTAKDFALRSDEVLAVKVFHIETIHDDCVLSGSRRELILKRIRSLNPKVFIFYAENAACNAPFFMTRFRESVKYYSAIFDGFGLSMAPDDPNRVILEREFHGPEILNIVSCEGQARVQRPEPYRHWQNRLQRAGFTQLPLNPVVYSKIKAMMATFHKDYGVGKDNGWLVMGINNQIVNATSVWEPTPLPGFIT